MTKQQAIDFLFQSWEEHDSEARGITEAISIDEGRYIVRNNSGQAVTITNRSDFARGARNYHSGTIYDRCDWRNTSPKLQLTEGEIYAR